MNCDHALGLIDSQGLRRLASDQLAKLEHHAQECETCGPALTRSTPHPGDGAASRVTPGWDAISGEIPTSKPQSQQNPDPKSQQHPTFNAQRAR